MSTPRYRHRETGAEVEAIRVIQADPTTHWHVNVGDDISDLLGGAYWVPATGGAALVNDGDYVVRVVETGALSVCPGAEFDGLYEAMPAE
jgi:hypothetical protein